MLGTTIFLAGSEIEKLALALLQNGVKWVLFSYFYILRFKRTGMIERLQREYPDVQWLLDSGAFTYAVQKTRPGGPGIFLPEPEQYVRGYFDYIERFGERWVRIAEPDLDGIPGMPISVQQVTDWREEMLTRWPHLPIMPCWHAWRSWTAWEQYLADPRIKHLSFGRSSGDDVLRRKMCTTAHQAGKTVHGFGFTKINTSLKHGVEVDSTDSTSWLMGQKYGISYVFENAKWIVLTKDEKRKRAQFRRYYERIGCDYKLIEKDDLAEVRKANVLAWKLLADWFHVRKERRDVVLEGWLEHGHLPVLPRSEEFVHPGRVVPLERTALDLRGSSARERNALETVIARAKALPRDGEGGVVLHESAVSRPRGILREFGVGISDTRAKARPIPFEKE